MVDDKKIVKIKITRKMKQELNAIAAIARKFGFPERDEEPEELECLF